MTFGYPVLLDFKNILYSCIPGCSCGGCYPGVMKISPEAGDLISDPSFITVTEEP